jgi:hypothetical protein
MTPERFRYAEPGTLTPPGPIGRVVRFILAAFCLDVALMIATQPSAFVTGHALRAPSLWVAILIGLWVFPDVVSLGFGKPWKRSRLLMGVAALAGVASLVGWAAYGSAVGPPLGVVAGIWLIYTFGHLGISFLLATFLATPGCEMRSIPQLWALVSGAKAKEHYCPGVLTPVDRWEAKLRAK